MRKLALGSLIVSSMALLPAGASAQERLLRGDVDHGGSLFRMECAPCHGVDGKGSDFWRGATADKPQLGTLPDLSDNAFLAQRSDAELRRAIRTGHGRAGWIAGHAFRDLSTLDAWDLVQFLRHDSVPVDQVFSSAAKFTAKDFLIDSYGVERLATSYQVELAQDEMKVVVLTVYRGQRAANEQVRLIPWTPVELDLLHAADRLGFLSFVDLVVPRSGEKLDVGLAFGTDGKLQKVVVRHPDAARRASYQQALSAFVGQGAKGGAVYKAPKGVKDGDLWAKALTRSANIAAEGVTMYEKAERARTAFDL